MADELQIEAPGDSLQRDLAAGRRVMVARPQICVVRAMPDLGDRVLRFVLATPGVKGDGHSVDTTPEGWDLSRAKKRCPMLWSHSYGDRKTAPIPQIGEWPGIDFERDADLGGSVMVGDGRFAGPHHELAECLYRMYLPRDKGGDGLRGASSIGWFPLEATPNEFGGYHMTYNLLTEASLVNVGEDEGALQRALMGRIQKGEVPEKVAEFFLGGKLQAARGADRWMLDWHDRPIEIRSAPADVAAAETSQEAKPFAADDSVTILGERSDTVQFARVGDGKIAVVLEYRGDDAPTKDEAARIAKLCRSAIAERKAPTLPSTWRAVPVVADRPMLLRGDGDRAAVVRAMTDSLAAGKTPVLPMGWSLEPVRSSGFQRSARSDALDALYAQFDALRIALQDPTWRLWWALNDVFYEDETGQSYGGAVSTETRAEREVKVLGSLLESLADILVEVAANLEPAPQADTLYTAGLQRAGKKYAEKRYKTLKTAREKHKEAGDLIDVLIEEADAERQVDDAETASGEPSLSRLAEDLEARASEVGPSAKSRPADRPSPEVRGALDDVLGLLRRETRSEPNATGLGDMAADLNESRGAA